MLLAILFSITITALLLVAIFSKVDDIYKLLCEPIKVKPPSEAPPPDWLQ